MCVMGKREGICEMLSIELLLSSEMRNENGGDGKKGMKIKKRNT